MRKIKVRDIVPLFDHFEILKATVAGNGTTIKMAFPTPAVWEDIADLTVIGIKKKSDCIELVVDLGVRSVRRKSSHE